MIHGRINGGTVTCILLLDCDKASAPDERIDEDTFPGGFNHSSRA